MANITLPLTSDIQKLEPSGIIELFEVDATSFGGDIYRFHSGTNGLLQDVVWKGLTYSAFPIEASGFEYTANGQLPRPKVSVSNVSAIITFLVLNYDDLVGAKFIRRRTLIKYLDAVNFPGAVNPDADPGAEFADDIYFIDRKTTETKSVVEFELAAAFDLAGIQLPRRQIIQNVCVWKYRGTECGWTTPDPKRNLLTYSQDFTNAVWTKENTIGVTANSGTAPDATNTATRLLFPTGTLPRIYQTIPISPTATTIVTFSIYAKSNTGANQSLGIFLRQAAFGTVYASFNATVTTAWQRFQITATIPAGISVMALLYQSTPSNPTNDVLVWGAQLELGSTVSTYQYVAALYITPTYYDANDVAVGSITYDVCGKRLSSCQKRFGEKNQLSFGSFPSVALIR